MKRISVAIVVFVALAGQATAQSKSPGPGISPKPLEATLDAFIAQGMKDWKIPGLSIVVVKDGATVYEKRCVKDSSDAERHCILAGDECSPAASRPT